MSEPEIYIHIHYHVGFGAVKSEWAVVWYGCVGGNSGRWVRITFCNHHFPPEPFQMPFTYIERKVATVV